jgi:hypothetical protein
MDGMKTGTRTNGPASLKVSFSQMVPPTQRGLVREVSAILCDQASRGKGHASDLLADVLRDADAARVTLLVVVEPFADEPMGLEALSAWYARHGFVSIQASPRVMARMPQAIQ